MHVVLTGATGYVGRRVAARLIGRGDAVTGVVRAEARAASLPAGVVPAVAPLEDPGSLAALAVGADAVVLTAFPTHQGDWFAAVDIERDAVAHLVATLAGTGTRLVVSNGTAFYGDVSGFAVEREALDGHPTAIRAAATAPATTTDGLHGVELRLASFVFGGGGSVFLPVLVDHARRTGRSIYIGDGENRISAVHVDAAADAYVAAVDRGRAGSIYHVASDDAPTMRMLAEAIAIGTGAAAVSVTGAEAAAAVGPFTALFLALENGLSSQRARAELGWSPAGHPPLLWDVAHGSYAG